MPGNVHAMLCACNSLIRRRSNGSLQHDCCSKGCIPCRCVVMVGMPFPNPTNLELCERMRLLDACAAKAGSGTSCSSGGRAQPTAGREYFEDLCMKAVNQCIGRVIRHRGDWAVIVLADARWAAQPFCHGAGASPSLLHASTAHARSAHTRHRLLLHACDQHAASGALDKKMFLCGTACVLKHYSLRRSEDGCGTAGSPPGGPSPLAKLPGWIQESLVVASGFGDAFGRIHRFARSMREQR